MIQILKYQAKWILDSGYLDDYLVTGEDIKPEIKVVLSWHPSQCFLLEDWPLEEPLWCRKQLFGPSSRKVFSILLIILLLLPRLLWLRLSQRLLFSQQQQPSASSSRTPLKFCINPLQQQPHPSSSLLFLLSSGQNLISDFVNVAAHSKPLLSLCSVAKTAPQGAIDKKRGRFSLTRNT